MALQTYQIIKQSETIRNHQATIRPHPPSSAKSLIPTRPCSSSSGVSFANAPRQARASGSPRHCTRRLANVTWGVSTRPVTRHGRGERGNTWGHFQWKKVKNMGKITVFCGGIIWKAKKHRKQMIMLSGKIWKEIDTSRTKTQVEWRKRQFLNRWTWCLSWPTWQGNSNPEKVDVSSRWWYQPE